MSVIGALGVPVLRANAAALLATACTISRVVRSADGMGGVAEVWSTLATTTCRIRPMRSREQEQIVEGRLGLLQLWVVALPAGTDVTIKDRVVAGGLTYEVAAVGAPRTYEITRTCLCTLVQ